MRFSAAIRMTYSALTDVCKINETVVKARYTRGLMRLLPNKFEGATLGSFNNAKLHNSDFLILAGS
jgi:hypothetical protein